MCVCNTALGWSGINCLDWVDPCRQWALDGCVTCVTQSKLKCLYCMEYKCVADSKQSGIPSNATHCSSYFDSTGVAQCPRYNPKTGSSASDIGLILLIVGFVVLALVTCFSLLLFCIYRQARPNPLITLAVAGIPDFEYPSHEREVMQVQLVDQEAHRGKRIQGIPLKQIDLRELYKLQSRNSEECEMTAMFAHPTTTDQLLFYSFTNFFELWQVRNC